jgi:hypothetical protein
MNGFNAVTAMELLVKRQKNKLASKKSNPSSMTTVLAFKAKERAKKVLLKSVKKLERRKNSGFSC